MDFGVRPRDKTPKSGVAHYKISPSQESENEQIQNKIDAHFFLRDRKEFVPPGQIVNQTFYREVLERLRKRVARVRPGIARTWMLHHNAPCHTAVSINEFWTEKKHSCGSSAPIFAGSSPCDFFLFPRLKNHLKGRHFGTLNNIQKSITDKLKGIPAEAFQHCYEQWKRLRRCVAAQGNYLKGITLICKENKIHG